MSRQILCRKCGEGYALTKADTSRGITMRKCYVSTKVPEGHGLKIGGVFMPLAEVHCDLCNEVVTGEIAVAVTVIPPEREILDWEHELGTVLTEDAVKLADKLRGYEGVGGPHAS